MEYYKTVKKKKFLPFATAWVDLAKQNKPVREKQIPYDLTYMWNLMN